MCSQLAADETSEPRITRVLTATNFLSHSLGILLVYILGMVMEWNIVSGVSTAFPLLSLVAFVLLPESPVWLIKNNKMQEAEKALWRLRGGAAGLQVSTMGQRCGLWVNWAKKKTSVADLKWVLWHAPLQMTDALKSHACPGWNSHQNFVSVANHLQQTSHTSSANRWRSHTRYADRKTRKFSLYIVPSLWMGYSRLHNNR